MVDITHDSCIFCDEKNIYKVVMIFFQFNMVNLKPIYRVHVFCK